MRKMTWAILGWSGLCLIWMVTGAHSASQRINSDCLPGNNLCQQAGTVGTGIGLSIILFVWFLGFVMLSIIWFMTRLSGQDAVRNAGPVTTLVAVRPPALTAKCSECGAPNRPDATSCVSCGVSFLDEPQLT